MTGRIEAAEVAGHEPAVHDAFGGEFGLVEVAGHYGFAAHGDFADTVGIGIDDADLHAGERLADGVGTERLLIGFGDACDRFGGAVSICYHNPEYVEDMDNMRLSDSAPSVNSA